MENKPSGIDERLDQLRPPVIKADGVTDSERYLARLGEKSFLNLWSYPGPFRDQKMNGKGDGKELCDLLVVCGNHIVIFSEKTIEWPSGDLDIAWRRWAKRALESSAKQAKGAERWIAEYPDRVFLDRECTVPFPIDFPPLNNRIVHRVLVARGASRACRDHFGGGSGSLHIKPEILHDQHWSNLKDVQPFAVGDIDPSGSFVHVFDEVSLDIVLGELDTIRDFTDYLEKRKEFIRSGDLFEAHGEENLLAFYAIRINAEGDHDFVRDDLSTPISIDRTHYENLTSDPRYIAKKREDEISYIWDKLIEVFTDHMLGGTSITLDEYEFDLRKNELGVRYMALQSRLTRRAHGQAVVGALEKGKETDRFFRTMLSPAGSKDNETAFFIQTFKYLDWMEEKGGYEHYRRKRTESALVYAQGLLERHPHLERVVGISREPPLQGRGVSEDLIYAEQADWTDEQRAAIKEDCKTLGVLQGELKERAWGGQEFPDVASIVLERPPLRRVPNSPNRKQRRAMKSKARKKR